MYLQNNHQEQHQVTHFHNCHHQGQRMNSTSVFEQERSLRSKQTGFHQRDQMTLMSSIVEKTSSKLTIAGVIVGDNVAESVVGETVGAFLVTVIGLSVLRSLLPPVVIILNFIIRIIVTNTTFCFTFFILKTKRTYSSING